ncbi:MAG TPA: 6-phosphogluconolactonase [Rhizomicrobium sp.]
MAETCMQGRLEIAKDSDKLAQNAAEWFVGRVNARTENLRISLSGGSTPKKLYCLLGSAGFSAQMPWQRLDLFWGDERFVSHESADSNYRMARETLLASAPIARERVHPVPTDGTPADAAIRYETELKRSYGAEVLDPSKALFEVMFLGLGSDGHTCSLLPGQPVLEERRHWVAPVMSGRGEPRVTLTYPAIGSSRALAFLVAGADKAEAVKAVRAGNRNLPAARIRTSGEVIWFVDSAAAGELTG